MDTFIKFCRNYYSNSQVVYYLIHEWSQIITIVNTIQIIAQSPSRYDRDPFLLFGSMFLLLGIIICDCLCKNQPSLGVRELCRNNF